MALAFSFLHTPDVNKHVAYSRQVRTIMSATILSQQPLWHPCLHLVPTNIRKRSSIEATARRGGWNASSLPLASPVETVESTSSALWRGIRLLELKNEFIFKTTFYVCLSSSTPFLFFTCRGWKADGEFTGSFKVVSLCFSSEIGLTLLKSSFFLVWMEVYGWEKKVLHLSIYLFMGFHI